MIVIFEDNTFEQFYPFTLNHSTFEIKKGANTLLESLTNNVEESSMVLIVRDSIEEIVRERYPEAIVNPSDIPNGCEEIHLSENLNKNNLFHFSGLPQDWDGAPFFGKYGTPEKSSIMINQSEIHISELARVSAGVILDASKGPIVIDDHALIDIGALIKGPVYIGKNSTINPGAKLKDVNIGAYCKIGGEVEHTTFHGFSNKQHDGYLGHSYIGEWVNLGANTNNSDLKNNYSDVKVNMGNKEINAGMFAGCLIGDYTKTGISTMINTGTYIGLGCNIFGSGFQHKHIPNFSWGMNDEKTDLYKFLQSLKIVKARRNQDITPAELKLLENIYKNKI
jgi:UDP-N-acetylglucosamine diphosphorylase/glucosamine-1-phosphate N-acetyltransferase